MGGYYTLNERSLKPSNISADEERDLSLCITSARKSSIDDWKAIFVF
jgi:hypothetical protein